jgi:hypothetical protein
MKLLLSREHVFCYVDRCTDCPWNITCTGIVVKSVYFLPNAVYVHNIDVSTLQHQIYSYGTEPRPSTVTVSTAPYHAIVFIMK